MRSHIFTIILIVFGFYIYTDMTEQSGYERGVDDGIILGREECEIATGHPFEDILPNRIEPLCWKILYEKYGVTNGTN